MNSYHTADHQDHSGLFVFSGQKITLKQTLALRLGKLFTELSIKYTRLYVHKLPTYYSVIQI